MILIPRMLATRGCLSEASGCCELQTRRLANDSPQSSGDWWGSWGAITLDFRRSRCSIEWVNRLLRLLTHMLRTILQTKLLLKRVVIEFAKAEWQETSLTSLADFGSAISYAALRQIPAVFGFVCSW